MTSTAVQRRPMRAVPAAVPHANHRVFPVLFSPTLDLSGLLRRPENSYRWIGQGTLLVDEHGVRVTARRLTFFGLYRTVLFILPTEIREVYREGDSIRVDLQAGTRHSFFRLWAEGAGTAAEIVKRLPTSRTIELEGPAWSSGAASSDAYWSAMWLVLAVALVGSLGWLGVERFLSHHGPTPLDGSGRMQGATTIVPGDVSDSGSDVGTLAARAELEKFTQRFDSLSLQFSTAFTALQRGSLSQDEFIDGVEKWLLPQWEALGAEPEAAANSEIRTVIDNWHLALMAYAHGLRAHDPGEVVSAFNYMRIAEAHQVIARARLDELDGQR
ncbi:MAG TPA: hypothetical protein VI653_01195 [Steroidobacteraceae bacterium]